MSATSEIKNPTFSEDAGNSDNCLNRVLIDRTNTALVDTVLYAETLLSSAPLRALCSPGLCSTVFRGHFQATAIQPKLCPSQTFNYPQLKDFDVFSGTHDKSIIREADDARSNRQFQKQEIVIYDFPSNWSYPQPLRSATCNIFFERLFVILIYHPPIAQIVIYHPQRVVWNLLLHHRLDSDLPFRGIERTAYVNSDQCAESLTLTSSSMCICGNLRLLKSITTTQDRENQNGRDQS